MDRLSVLRSRSAYSDKDTVYEPVSHGSGAYVFTPSGSRYFDAGGGSGSLIFGHGDRAMAAVLAAQAATLTTFPGRRMGSDIVERYAERLVAFAPDGISRAITFSSGSDAVEAALKLAIQAQRRRGQPGRFKIIGREGSYHGNTLAGLAAGGFVARRKPYENALPKTGKAAAAHCPACAFGLAPDSCALECAASLEQVILDEGPDTVAAFIAEPVVGAALSAAVPDPRYFARIRQICDRYGVFLIADEVMTGFGRTGRRFGIDHGNVPADIVVAGKAISGGYFPLSAVLVHERIAALLEDRNEPFQNGHTHACSPLAAAVGLEVLGRLEDGKLIANAARRGTQIVDGLRRRLANSSIRNIRGQGLMIGADIAGRHASGAAQPRLAELFYDLAKARGLLIYSSTGSAGSEAGDHFLLLPPLTIGDADVSFIIDALSDAAAEFDRRLDTGRSTLPAGAEA